MAISTVAVASGEPVPGTGGVPVDLEGISLSFDNPGEPAVVPALLKSATAEVVDNAGKEIIAGEITPPATGADKAAPNDAQIMLKAIADAMRPKETIPPLSNDRLTVYLSDEVVFGQFDRSAERYGLDRSRVHLGLVYSEERDTVIQGGLAVDAAFSESFRLCLLYTSDAADE